MIFKSGYQITQHFGERPEYYGQFGLAGHEGLDIIPIDSDWTIYAPEGGTIVRDVDDPRYGGAYGNLVVLLSQDGTRAWWFAHNQENYVSIDQVVRKGQILSKMGATGNVSGPHVHLGLRRAVDGVAINLDNGYSGFIDPLPVLNSLGSEPTEQPTMDTGTQNGKVIFDRILIELKKLGLISSDDSRPYVENADSGFDMIWPVIYNEVAEHRRLAVKATDWDKLCNSLGFDNSDIIHFEEVKNKIDSDRFELENRLRNEASTELASTLAVCQEEKNNIKVELMTECSLEKDKLQAEIDDLRENGTVKIVKESVPIQKLLEGKSWLEKLLIVFNVLPEGVKSND